MGGRSSGSGKASAAGGRKTASSEKKSVSGGLGTSGNTTEFNITKLPKINKKTLGSASRKRLEYLATVTYVKQNVPKGLTMKEAVHRISLLMDGNTDAQLRSYIKKHG